METERFTWDENKRLSNIRKHQLDFNEAWKVFMGPTFTYNDTRYAYDATRFTTIGLLEGRPVSIGHTEDKDEIRIISFRKASKREERLLASNFDDGLEENR